MNNQFRNKTLKKHRKVALLMETSNEYSRGIIRGIYGYIKEHGRWDVYLGEYSRGEPNPDWLLSWNADGIIARIENQNIAELVTGCKLPTVDISAAKLIPGIPWVETDDEAISKMAAEHLIDCGFSNFGFAGTSFNWSKWRKDHFTNALARGGFLCNSIDICSNSKSNWIKDQKNIDYWVRSLPKPVGIFAAYDLLGRQVIDSCNKLGYLVPEEVSVLGVDNDPLLCELCSPPLTSIIPDTFKTGYTAASLLEAMICKNKTDKLIYKVKPLGIKKRRSTDTIAINDVYISRSMHYIFESAQRGTFNINDILSFVPMSRRVFEKTFKKLVGRTPYKEMQRVRVNRIKELLHHTDLTLFDIAEKAGFEHVSYMSYLFKRETGVSPALYREANCNSTSEN